MAENQAQEKQEEEIVIPNPEDFIEEGGEPEGGKGTDETPEVDPVEEAARERGWRPQDEFEGDPSTWIPAKEFMGRAPLYDSIHDLKRTIKRLQENQDEFRKHYDSVRDTAYKEAMATLQRQLDAAAEENDVKGVIATQRKMEQLHSSRTQEAPKKEEPTGNEQTPAFDQWLEKNNWYAKDEELQAYADGVALRLTRKHADDPDMTPAKLFEKVTEQVKKTHPHKFKSPAQRKATTVEGGGNPSSVGKKGVSYRDLPEEAQQVYKKLVKSDRNPRGILSHDEFMRDYLASSGPVNTGE